MTTIAEERLKVIEEDWCQAHQRELAELVRVYRLYQAIAPHVWTAASVLEMAGRSRGFAKDYGGLDPRERKATAAFADAVKLSALPAGRDRK